MALQDTLYLDVTVNRRHEADTLVSTQLDLDVPLNLLVEEDVTVNTSSQTDMER